MQSDTVIASVLPFIAHRDEQYKGDDQLSDVKPHRRSMETDYKPPVDGKTFKTLAELYTKLTLEEDTGKVTDRPLSETIGRFHFSEKRTVEVRVSYLKIIKIDTKKQIFCADVFVQAKWEEPKLYKKSHKDETNNLDLEDIVIEGYWNPEIYIYNLASSPDRQETWCDVFPGERHPTVVWKMRIQGAFNERLELEDFPFDVQELQVKVTSRLTEDKIVLVTDHDRLSTVNRHNMVDQSEWVLYDHVSSSKGIIRNKLPTARYHHPCLAFMCSARRIPTFYFVNIFFMMFLLSSMVFCTVGIPTTAYPERLKINVIILLTLVAMKYVATSFYPVDLAYLTYMDVYSLFCVFIVALMAIQNAILCLFKSDQSVQLRIDRGTIYLIIALFLLIQAVAVVVAIVVVCRAKYSMRQKDQEYLKEQRELNYRRNRKTNLNGESYGQSRNKIAIGVAGSKSRDHSDDEYSRRDGRRTQSDHTDDEYVYSTRRARKTRQVEDYSSAYPDRSDSWRGDVNRPRRMRHEPTTTL